MRNSIVAAGTAILFICTAFAASAEPRDSVERGDRMDRDALRDDVRIDRLKIPQHPDRRRGAAAARLQYEEQAEIKAEHGQQSLGWLQ
jgi:hypothetical protein